LLRRRITLCARRERRRVVADALPRSWDMTHVDPHWLVGRKVRVLWCARFAFSGACALSPAHLLLRRRRRRTRRRCVRCAPPLAPTRLRICCYFHFLFGA
jgi:hypothetical protein